MQRPHAQFGVLLVLFLMTCIGLVGCPFPPGGGGGEGEGEPAPGELGGACLADGTCNGALVCNPATDVCEEGEGDGEPAPGELSGPCLADGTCNEGLVCNAATDVCDEGEGEPTPGELGGPCLADGTCNEGLVCNPETDVCEEGDGEPAPGELGGPCLADGTCNEGLVCNPETDVCDEGEDEPAPSASVNEEWHFDEVEFSLFTEVAFPHLSAQVRTVDYESPEGVLEITYNYITPEQAAALDLDPPVREYPQGLGFYEGDVAFDIASEPFGPGLPGLQEGDGSTKALAKVSTYSAGISEWQRLWPRGEVPYKTASLADTFDESKIYKAMNYWKAAGIKFRPWKSSDGNRYMYFRKYASLKSGYTDGVGMDPGGGPRTVNLGYLVGTGLVAHEIGHGLGLFHEHARTDRDIFVNIFWDNVDSDHYWDYCKYNQTVALPPYCGVVNRFGRDIGNYDFGSLMHYGSYTFGKVSVAKVFVNGLSCALWPFRSSCWQSQTYVERTMERKDGSTIVNNRSQPSNNDLDAIRELYKNADLCGGILGANPYGVVAFGGTNTFSHDLQACSNRLYTADTPADYRMLNLTIDSLNFDIPEDDFLVELDTPSPLGGRDVIRASNPGSDLTKLVLNTELLPGHHRLKLTNWLPDNVQYTMSFAFTPANVPMDSHDKAGVGNSLSNPIDIGVLPETPFMTKTVSDATIHNPADIDYYVMRLPELPSWAIENYCDQAKGPHNANIQPGYFEIRIERQDNHRILRTVVYKNLPSGEPNPDPEQGFRPWGWGTKGMKVECPYKYFDGQDIYFSVEDCSNASGDLEVNSQTGVCTKTKRHYYKLRVIFRFTSEDRAPIRPPDLSVLPDMFDPGPVPDFLTPRAIEFIINQGQDFMDLLPDDLKAEYGFDELLIGGDPLADDIFIPNNLQTQFEEHFTEFASLEEEY